MRNFDDKYNGCLEGLKGDTLEIVKEYLNKIDMNKVSEGNAREIFIPVIKHIIIMIVEGKEHGFTSISDYEDSYDNWCAITSAGILKLVDIDEIIILFNNYYSNFVPLAEKYLPYIDAHAEAILLFCRSYIFMLIDRFLKHKQ
jgi:hypothetical protein